MKQNTKSVAVVAASLLLGSGFSAMAQDIQNSVVSVGQMMKIDNAQAVARAQDEAAKSGILTDHRSGAKKEDVPLPVWSVRSVYGMANMKFADLRVDSTSHSHIAVGKDVAMCHVDDIQNECVKLSPKTKKVRKGACPAVVCWNGSEIAAELQAKQSKSPDSSFRLTPVPPQPMPLPQVNPGAVQAPKVNE